jgi:hypothetical protein
MKRSIRIAAVCRIEQQGQLGCLPNVPPILVDLSEQFGIDLGSLVICFTYSERLTCDLYPYRQYVSTVLDLIKN